MSDEWELEIQPDAAKVLDYRINTEDLTEVLIKWQDFPDFENSWEYLQDCKNSFLHFTLKTS